MIFNNNVLVKFFLYLYNGLIIWIINLDPLDPLTEIINSGQGFSPSIALERFLWLMIGFFFIGAIFTSITREMMQNDWFGNNSFLSNLKATKRKDKLPNKLSEDDK